MQVQGEISPRALEADPNIELSDIGKPIGGASQEAFQEQKAEPCGLDENVPKIEKDVRLDGPASEEDSVSFESFAQGRASEANVAPSASHHAEIAEAFAAFSQQQSTRVRTPHEVDQIVVEIERNQVTYRAPRPIGPDWSAAQFREELLEILCAREPQGAVSNHLLALYNQSQTETPDPPGLAEILRQISGDSSYAAERKRFLKACRNTSRFSINTSFSQMQQGQDFSLMADLGDIVAFYGSETGFQCVCPLQAQQRAAQELQAFFTDVTPRTCMGYTLTFVQAKRLLEDAFVAQFFSQTELQALFARALFIQTKFILDYCEHNPARRPAATRTLSITSYDCFEYRNDAVPDRREFDVRSTSGRNLCYVGVLQLLCLVQKMIIEKFRPKYLCNIQGMVSDDRPAAKKDGEATQSEEEEDVVQRVSRQNRAHEIPVLRDPFGSVLQIDAESSRPASSAKASAWKVALSFGAFLDCYILRFARRFGVQIANKIMQKTIGEFPEAVEVFSKYATQIRKRFDTETAGNEIATRGQIARILGPLRITSDFIDEYVLRNYTRTDSSFRTALGFEEFANCLFVAANVKLSVHPWLARLPTPADRLRYASEVILGWKK